MLRYGITDCQQIGMKFPAAEQALREHCQQHEVTLTKETGFGPRYEVEGD
jgi:hypothetical protein